MIKHFIYAFLGFWVVMLILASWFTVSIALTIWFVSLAQWCGYQPIEPIIKICAVTAMFSTSSVYFAGLMTFIHKVIQ